MLGRRLVPLFALLVATPVAVVMTAQPASAYCWLGDKWSTASPHEVWADTTIPGTWSPIVSASVTAWNNATGSWNASYIPPGNFGPPYRGGWVARIDFSNAGYADVPASTLSNWTSNMTWADTYLNTDWSWNTSGTMNQAGKNVDVRTIVIHELGHWLSLDHPNQCGSMTTNEINAVMNPNWTNKPNLNADDNAGSSAVYP
ncbi:MAG: hypothetical protein QOE45_455 [Frankiaceae bacterium]|jgi:hypothetical protein|nr:hypothetical protein [Frankiaceae bacterium]